MSEKEAVVQAIDDRAIKDSSLFKRLSRTTATYIFLVNVFLVIFFGMKSNQHTYVSSQNLQNLMGNGAQSLLLALGVAILMATGVFDLSLGANLVLSSVIGAKVIRSLSHVNLDTAATSAPGYVYVAGFAACVITGALIGLINAIIINKLKVNTLIATLGTLSIATGIAYVITNGMDVSALPMEMQDILAMRKILGIPAPAFLSFAVALSLFFVLRYTRFGVNSLAIGSNIVAASRAGIRIERHRIILLMAVGAICGLAGFMDLSKFTSTSLAGHVNDGLTAVTAAVIGGTALAGGRTSIIGTLWGTILSVQLLTGLIIINVPPFYQLVATGGFLILAVWLDGLRLKTRSEN